MLPEVGARVRSVRSGAVGSVVEGQCVPMPIGHLLHVHWDGCEWPGTVCSDNVEVLSPLEQLAEV